MNKILKSMEKKGWKLAGTKWLDFDEQYKPIVRFVNDDVDLIPLECVDHVVEQPIPIMTALFGGLAITPIFKKDSLGDSSFFSKHGMHTPVYITLSVTVSELKEILQQQPLNGRKEKTELYNPDVETSLEVSDTNPTFRYENSFSAAQREIFNKKLAEANIKEDLKNKIRQNIIWLGGGVPGF